MARRSDGEGRGCYKGDVLEEEADAGGVGEGTEGVAAGGPEPVEEGPVVDVGGLLVGGGQAPHGGGQPRQDVLLRRRRRHVPPSGFRHVAAERGREREMQPLLVRAGEVNHTCRTCEEGAVRRRLPQRYLFVFMLEDDDDILACPDEAFIFHHELGVDFSQG